MFKFITPTESDAETLLRWRTSPPVTEFMFSDINPTLEEQRAWIKSCNERSDFKHYIIYYDDLAIGYQSFTEINYDHGICSSGNYIADPDHQRYGGYLHNFIMDYCFYALKMHKVVNYFMHGNDKVITMQHKLKCRFVGTFKDHIYKNKRYYDVHIFELKREDYETHPHPFKRETTLAAFGLNTHGEDLNTQQGQYHV